jgi:flavodoxin
VPTTSAEPAAGGGTLVVYFSCTGNTKAAAQTIAGAANGTLYEITPAQPYTDADLDYNDSKSRTTVEQNDSSSRPEISGSVENWEQYDTVFLGYPIWWGTAPRILDTFVESYDFTGKTVIPVLHLRRQRHRIERRGSQGACRRKRAPGWTAND